MSSLVALRLHPPINVTVLTSLCCSTGIRWSGPSSGWMRSADGLCSHQTFAPHALIPSHSHSLTSTPSHSHPLTLPSPHTLTPSYFTPLHSHPLILHPLTLSPPHTLTPSHSHSRAISCHLHPSQLHGP